MIIQTLNYEQLFNKIGLASVVFKSGKFKDMLNGARPITPEERDYIQSFVMKTYDKFLGIVAKGAQPSGRGLAQRHRRRTHSLGSGRAWMTS